MAPLTDPDRLLAYRDALANWNFAGYVRFELNEVAYRWVREELDDVSLKELARRMFEHVTGGGEIDEVRETRPLWSESWEHHYDLRFEIQGKQVYIETRLQYRLPVWPDESSIIVVNIYGA